MSPSPYPDEEEIFLIENLLYCSLISGCSNQVTNSFISSRGLGHFEALATTLSSSLNLFVVGQDFSAMARAASKVAEMGGRNSPY